MGKFFSNVFAQSNPSLQDNKALTEVLSRKRAVVKSSMNSTNIKAGIEQRSKQLTDPEFASDVLENTLSKLKVD